MPQADVLSFHPTMLFLPVFFLGGYFFFVTRWVPRLLLTLKARAWLTTLSVLPVGFPGGPTGWPEIFLMFIQFGGLLFFISTLTLVGPATTRLAAPRGATPAGVVTFESTGGARVENFLAAWGPTREVFLFRPLATELTTLVDRLVGGLSFFVPGKQFPALLGRLRVRLENSAGRLAVAGVAGVDFLNNCAYLKVVLVVGFGLAGVIFTVSAALAPSVFNFDKSGSYECGFDPFEDARSRFDVRFYLVALLFIIFDLEVAFLFPLVGGTFPAAGVAVATVFLGVLTLGFVYEWSEGALQWS